MATRAARQEILPPGASESAALQHRPWNSARRLSRGLEAVERFLGNAGFDRMPWLAVAFGAGVAAWFVLPSPGYWRSLMVVCGALSASSAAVFHAQGRYPYLRLSGIVVPLVVAAGCGSVWARSHLVGAEPIATPVVATLTGKVLAVEPQPAQARSRVVLATREPGGERAIRVRINIFDTIASSDGLHAGDVIKLRARLMPPAAPMLPGAYNFARTAWFKGLSATGTALSAPEIVERGGSALWLSSAKRRISSHIRDQLDQGESGIAAALATGDVGGIAESDAQAMRDAGLAHLLSISGLHVSAVIAAVYFVALRLLALSPWLTLRVRLPIVAAGFGALAGLSYTLLTGAQVPTVRSCIGALLVLAALALGREPLSLRMLAVAAFLVMLLWPEALVGPSFQMSFAAVLAIIALSGAQPVRQFLAPRDEGMGVRALRHLALVLLTGFVIEFALMPIGLHHFHRAGIYGAFANVVAIPLTTFVIMPMVFGALVLDLAGPGAPAWWIAGHAIAALTALAHGIASRPGAVTVIPAMAGTAFALFIAGGLWLGLWSGKVRWFGLAPALLGAVLVATARPPDLLISGDGRHVGLLSSETDALFVLRTTRSDFVTDNLIEVAGMQGTPIPLTSLSGANCNRDTCVVAVTRGGRDWQLLLTRSRDAVPERALAAACERVDLVISDRWLPRSCRPRWVKVDRRFLSRTGGLAIDLEHARITSVADSEGQHGWWRGTGDHRRPQPRDAAGSGAP